MAAALSVTLFSGLVMASPSTQVPWEDPNVIPMQGNQFAIPQMVVPAGTTLTWVNLDGEQHDVIAMDLAFESPLINSGGFWSMTFAQPGTYAYLCDLHANMEGLVIVE